MNTPDTEWEKEFDGHMTSLSRYGGFYHGNKNGVELYDFNNIKAFIKDLLTSRDTYWKERVRKEVEGMKEKYSRRELQQGGYSQACDDILQALDNLK